MAIFGFSTINTTRNFAFLKKNSKFVDMLGELTNNNEYNNNNNNTLDSCRWLWQERLATDFNITAADIVYYGVNEIGQRQHHVDLQEKARNYYVIQDTYELHHPFIHLFIHSS